MVLVVGDTELKSSITLPELYSSRPELLEKGHKFARIPPRQVDPEGIVYVRQKEDAVTFVGDRFANGNLVKTAGTQDVLTCHVVVLHHPDSGVTAIGHYDEYVRERRLNALVNRFCERVVDRSYIYFDDDEDEDYGDEWEWEEVSEDDSSQDEANQDEGKN